MSGCIEVHTACAQSHLTEEVPFAYLAGQTNHPEVPNLRNTHVSGIRCGHGSKLNHQGTADVSPCFHLPGLHFGAMSPFRVS